MDIYFPSSYVDQADLEEHDKVAKGKYTIGLGQSGLAYCGDREDIYSMCMTAVQGFMEKYNLSPKDIGRLEVATETILDHAKAIKTVLMQLFEKSGNTDIEGVDTMNACYAGTNALFNSLAWVESSSWDGRYAMVVAADIAEYAVGPARPTGGAGAVVYLIGPNAPLVPSPIRASHMEHAYDFYKPNLESPYPVVDGKFSNVCYLRALDVCYQRYASKMQRVTGRVFDADNVDYFLFHSPYGKLVQKSFGRVIYNDFLLNPNKPQYANLKQFATLSKDESYTSTPLEKAALEVSKAAYAKKVIPASLLPKNLGNMYTGSLYAGLLSLLYTQSEKLAGKSISMFSYGSGLAASLFSIDVRDHAEARKDLARIRSISNLEQRLSQRIKASPVDFNSAMSLRENLHVTRSFKPIHSTDSFFPGTFYLTSKDEQGRRFYERKALN
jgi:hydroxymethylglutaryl-CoA synthase